MMPSPLNLSDPPLRALVIALGDPAGIGAEVTLKALSQPRPSLQRVELVGCRRWLEDTYMSLRDRSSEPLAIQPRSRSSTCPWSIRSNPVRAQRPLAQRASIG